LNMVNIMLIRDHLKINWSHKTKNYSVFLGGGFDVLPVSFF
jgi:hypothetical protein